MSAFISEVRYNSEDNNFVEIGVTTGTDLSGYSVYIYRSSGSVDSGPLSLGTLDSTNAGKDVYSINLGEDVLSSSGAVALVDDMGNVVQFISFNGNTVTATAGPANGETSTDVGSASSGQSMQTSDGGTTYTSGTTNQGTIPCYATGTRIDTPGGPRPVETLRVGDLVSTLDHGPLPIRWLREADQPLVDTAPDARPVRIAAGAFGPDCPARDLVVSPQHRILVGGHGQLEGPFDGECFAPAKALTGLPRIRFMRGKRRITWHHFALDRHAVVSAEGCLSESLLLGPMVTGGLTRAERAETRAVFGAAPIGHALNGAPARTCLRVGEVRRALGTSGTARISSAA